MGCIGEYTPSDSAAEQCTVYHRLSADLLKGHRWRCGQSADSLTGAAEQRAPDRRLVVFGEAAVQPKYNLSTT